jgi:23S rRNA (guanosine2251-2'-O)-methyltransferase
MLVYGKNVLYEVDKKKIKKIYCARKEYLNYLEKNKLHYEFVDEKRLNNLVKGNHQGIVIDIFDYEYYELSDITGDFVVALDHIEDPHNFGAIIRTCACAGIKNIIIPKDRAVGVTDTVVKVSEGTIDYVHITMVTNLNNALDKLKKMGYFVYASCMDGEDYRRLDTSGKKVLVIGNEGEGISSLTRKNADYLISIKMNNNIDSLNASVAAGILIFGMKD